MNKVVLCGRLVADPEVRQAGDKSVARYTLAVDRRVARQDGQTTADFISCVAWEKKAEFAEKYLHKGTKIVISGRLQSGSFEKDGQTHYTTEVVVEEQEFAESKQNAESNSNSSVTSNMGFMAVPEGIDEDLPFAAPL